MARDLLILVTKLAINVLALLVTDALFTGVRLETTEATFIAAIALALVNAYLRPFLLLLTLPLNILTLGLFTLVINALLLQFVGWLVPPFHVDNFATAVGAALVVSLVSVLLNWFLYPHRVQVRIHRR
jgi:putative membrane protein